MPVEPLYQLKIPAESLRMSLGIFCFCMICLIAGAIFIIFKMLFPVLNNRPVSLMALIVPVGLVLFLGLLGGVFFNQFNRKKSLIIELYKEGVKFEDSKDLVPYNEIQISRGTIEGLNFSEGVGSSVPLGEALIFKINHFDRHFKLNFLKQLSPEYVDKDIYKVRIGDTGLTEVQVTEFLQVFKRLSQSD